jgi:hypothetical protein
MQLKDSFWDKTSIRFYVNLSPYIDIKVKEKQGFVQAAEARERAARVHVSIARLEEKAASLEAETAEAKHQAELAAELARQASQTADQGRVAAEAQHRADMEARLRKEEADKRREEDEQQQQAKRLREKEIVRMERKEEMFACPEQEKQMDETDPNDPKNWSSYVYVLHGQVITCIIDKYVYMIDVVIPSNNQ